MAYTTSVAGTAITASWANANVRDQGVSPFATTVARDAAITSPVIGMVEYLSTNLSTEGLTCYNSAGSWRLPWNMPWGYITDVVVNVDQTLISAEADITSFTATPTIVGNRKYKVTFSFGASQVTSAGIQTIKISVDGSTSIVVTRSTPASGTVETLSGFFVVTGLAAGARVIKLRAATSAGTLSIVNSSGVNGRFLIEDIGPSGAPS